MQILAISGSLRAQSSNASLLRAVARVASEDVRVEIYEGMGDLPHFNPDLDAEGAIAPPPVRE
ncbi:MAG TPA: NAD(P)H-dependent oxidoreductase, partial [Thermoanaerobaculia bacterium]